MKKILTGVLFVILIMSFYTAASGNQDVRVIINDNEIVLTPSPIIINNRTFVPLRATFEILGATVEWDTANKRVTGRMGDRHISFVQGEKDSVIVNNRMMVPLRVISEGLGASIRWNSATRTVIVNTTIRTITMPQPPSDSAQVIIAGKGTIYIGMDIRYVISLLGEPDRREYTKNNYDWWVYYLDSGELSLIGVANNKVVAIYTNSSNWSMSEIVTGDSYKELNKTFPHEDFANATVRGEPGAILFFRGYTLHPDAINISRQRTVLVNNSIAVFYKDVHENNKVSAIRVVDKDAAFYTPISWVKFSPFEFNRPFANHATPASEKDARSQERLMADLVNSFRVRHGLNSLTWNEELAQLSRSHSLDMIANNFFGHTSPITGTIAQRAKDFGIVSRGVGENLARYTSDFIEAFHDLTNSLGHRQNKLYRRYTHIGIGVVQTHYTQKFMIR